MRMLAFAFALPLLVLAGVGKADPSFMGVGDVPGGNFRSEANAVSADGRTVVGWSVSASGVQASRWTQEGSIEGLGFLPDGGFESIAKGVTADGATVVGGGRRPFD